MAKTVAQYQADWQKAKAAGDQAGMDRAHAGAERVRADDGYSGGDDGSQKISTKKSSSSSKKSKKSSSKKSSSKSSSSDTWQDRLKSYETDTKAGNKEIKRAQEVWKEKTAAGDKAGADAAHRWAEQIRAVLGSGSKTDSTGAKKTSTKKTSTKTAKTNSAFDFSSLSSGKSGGDFDYMSMLKDIMNEGTGYKAPSESDMLTQAGQFASLQIDPMLSAIKQGLGTLQTNYDNEVGAVNAAYSGMQASTDANMAKANSMGMEDAIARGMGRSGVADYRISQLQAPVLQAQQQAEANKVAALSGLASSLTTNKSNLGTQEADALARKGVLTATQLAALRENAINGGINAQTGKFGQGLSIAQLAQQANTSESDLMMQLLPSLLYG